MPLAGPAPDDVIAFWRGAGPKLWFAKSPAFDAEIREKFEAAHHQAARGECDGWASDWQGCLALLLLLDQFPRNMFRQSPHAFATDPLALAIARQAIAQGFDQAAPAALRGFFYLPLEHSEDLADQDRCVALCRELDRETGGDLVKWAALHRDIIARFGRFPHRNRELGRQSSAEELRFLAEGGFSG